MKLLWINLFAFFFSQISYGRGELPGDLQCNSVHSNLRGFSSGLSEILDTNLMQTPSPKRDNRLVGDYANNFRTVVLSGARYPYSTIGKFRIVTKEVDAISMQYKWQICSGTMISKCHVLSAAHCFENANLKEQMPYFLLGDSKPVEVEKVSSLSSFKSLDHKGRRYHARDFAFIKLSNSQQDKDNFMSVAQTSHEHITNVDSKIHRSHNICKNGQIIAAGFSTDLNDGQNLSFDPKVTIIETTSQLIKFRGDTYVGSSGGAIFCFDNSGTPRVVGVNSTAVVNFDSEGKVVSNKTLPADETEKLAGAIPASLFYDEMLTFMQDNPCD